MITYSRGAAYGTSASVRSAPPARSSPRPPGLRTNIYIYMYIYIYIYIYMIIMSIIIIIIINFITITICKPFVNASA